MRISILQQREIKFSRQLSDDYGELLNPELYQRKYYVGLRNLGNTCFMNSSLQCLANITPLSKHFLSEMHEGEVNRKSKYGMKGKVAKEYYNVVMHLWGLSTEEPVYAPKAFKRTIAKYHKAFSGTQQHDAHELLTFLLNGLHEDLNRVLVKPEVEDVESKDREDAVVSAEAWVR
jgi:ubiquitin C-terminal hydrolase